MNSRERLLAAFDRKIPDRVPISTYGLVGHNDKRFENKDLSYSALMDVVRQKTDCIYMWDPPSDLVLLESAYPLRVDVEKTRENGHVITRKRFFTPKGEVTQTTKVMDGVHTVWQTEHLCKNLADVDKVLSVPFEPVTYDFASFEQHKADLGDNGIIMTTLTDPLWTTADLMEFGEFTIWAITEEERFKKALEIVHNRCMENLTRMLDNCTVDMYRICGSEYATPPYLPPRLFEKFVTPYVREMVELIHSRGAKARLHCHGKIGEVLDMITATGCDSIDPCEAPPDGDIALADVKDRIGDQMCILGNIQMHLLETASREEVREAVKTSMAAAKRGGGFVIMPTASPINSPLSPRTEENYMEFIEASLEFGSY